MSTKITKLFPIPMPDGSTWDVEMTARRSEYMYGEDADGNRGEKRVEIEGVSVSDAEMGRFKNALEKAGRNLDAAEWE